jgi:hypothetical protein
MSNFSVLDSILMPSAVKAEYSGTPDSMNPIGSYPDAAHTEKETPRYQPVKGMPLNPLLQG